MEKSPLIKPFFTAFLTTSKIFLESSKDGPITPYRLDLVCLTGAGFCYLKKKSNPNLIATQHKLLERCLANFAELI